MNLQIWFEEKGKRVRNLRREFVDKFNIPQYLYRPGYGKGKGNRN